MDLTASRPWWPLGDMDQMREALQYWIANNWDTSITVGTWWDRVATAGLAVPTWNRSHGGLATTAQVQQVVEEELAAAGPLRRHWPAPAYAWSAPSCVSSPAPNRQRRCSPRCSPASTCGPCC